MNKFYFVETNEKGEEVKSKPNLKTTKQFKQISSTKSLANHAPLVSKELPRFNNMATPIKKDKKVFHHKGKIKEIQQAQVKLLSEYNSPSTGKYTNVTIEHQDNNQQTLRSNFFVKD